MPTLEKRATFTFMCAGFEGCAEHNEKALRHPQGMPVDMVWCIPRTRYIARRGDVSCKKNKAEQLPQTLPRAANRYGNFSKLNIRSLAAYERARRALRGVCEPMRRASPGEIPRTGHQHTKKKSTTNVVLSVCW